MLFSLVKNENTQSYIYTNLILAWGGGVYSCMPEVYSSNDSQ